MPWTREEFRGRSSEWDRLAAGFADFTPMQSHAWVEARSREGWRARRDVWRDDSGEVVAAAATLSRRRLGLRLRYVSRGPMVLREGLSRAEAENRFETCVQRYRDDLAFGDVLVFALYPSLAEIGPETIARAGLRPLFPTTEPHAFSALVPLSDAAVLPSRASSDWRNRFRRSEELLRDVRESDTLDAFRRARRLVADLEQEKGFRTAVPDALLEAMASSGGRVFYLEDSRGDMTAAVIVAVAGRRAFRVLAGVVPEEIRRHPGAGRVLEVAVTRWAHDAGLRDYDVEGMNPASRGVWDFKAGMRGVMFASAGLHAISRPGILAAAASFLRGRRWTTALHLARSSPRYFAGSLLRRAGGGRVDARRMLVYRRDLRDAAGVDAPAGFAFEVLDRFDAEDLRFRLSTVRELGPRLAALRRDSLECGIIWARDGYAAAYGFVRRGEAPIPEVGGGLELGANDVYVYDCFVSPSFRGRRLYPFLLRQLCAHARRRGAERAFIAVDAANVPSVRGIEAAGFRRDRAALYHRLGPLRSLRWEECRG